MRAVILAEAAALTALAESINSHFDHAISILWSCQGKVIVTGMGKAGLIGRKVAATFQSTGTRAAFLDPAAAAHGDMGMIGHHDVLLALSNSGETEEVIHVAAYCLEHHLPIIVITSNQATELPRHAEVTLGLPVMPEGCPIGRAPMASTAMMMALGDALAAELMVRRGFTEADFVALHHGGYLGKAIRANA